MVTKLPNKLLLAAATLLRITSAHTVFTNFYVNGDAVTPGKCIRMPQTPGSATNPLPNRSITGQDIACGVNGNVGVVQTCQVEDGALLTFNFRACPDNKCPGNASPVPIDVSHKGPCAIYMKKVDNAAANDNAAGPGWFKIFQHDYDASEQKWCTEKIIQSGGLLSAKIPSGLQGGDYLVRTEVLALHQADKTPADPQFYIGCAQTFLNSSGTVVPPAESKVSIPGYVSMESNTAALTFNIWSNKMALPYPMFGPPVFTGASSASSSPQVKAKLSIQFKATTSPSASQERNCIIENGNWCGTAVPAFSDSKSCASSRENCWAQSKACYQEASQQAIGHANCTAWENFCSANDRACSAGESGPDTANLKVAVALPRIEPPAILGVGTGGSGGGGGGGGAGGSEGGKTTAAASAPVAASPSVAVVVVTTTVIAEQNPVATPAPAPDQSSTTPQENKPFEQSAYAFGRGDTGSVNACGAKNSSVICASSLCCSPHGFCGDSVDYCGLGCQREFGRCD